MSRGSPLNEIKDWYLIAAVFFFLIGLGTCSILLAKGVIWLFQLIQI